MRLLTEQNHPRAKAFDVYGAKQPTWTHPNGKKYPVYSASLIDTSGHEFAEAFRLDTGPLCLVWAGLMEASDERMRRFADYFRVGPDVTLWGNGIRKNPLARPILEREISSYSLLAGSLSPQTYIGGEHRHGMYGLVAPNALPARLDRGGPGDRLREDADVVRPGEFQVQGNAQRRRHLGVRVGQLA